MQIGLRGSFRCVPVVTDELFCVSSAPSAAGASEPSDVVPVLLSPSQNKKITNRNRKKEKK